MTSEFWFARRFPLSNPRKAIGPVHWKGWAVTAIFVAALGAGAVAFAWFGASGQMVTGIIVFALVAAACSAWFVSVAYSKADKTRTVADYRKDRARV